MTKSVTSIKCRNLRKSFLDDLACISNASTEACFKKVSLLFLEKWEEVEGAEKPYNKMKDYWLSDRLTRFYRGAAEGFVMKNNGLEATNRVFKDECTLRERMPIMEMLPAIVDWIGNVSLRRDDTRDHQDCDGRSRPRDKRHDRWLCTGNILHSR